MRRIALNAAIDAAPTMNAKNLILNGEPYSSPAPNVEALLAELKLHGRRVAVMVNDTVVRRAEFAGQSIAEGDRVEVISLIGGG